MESGRPRPHRDASRVADEMRENALGGTPGAAGEDARSP
jgi:hypothetical protein